MGLRLDCTVVVGLGHYGVPCAGYLVIMEKIVPNIVQLKLINKLLTLGNRFILVPKLLDGLLNHIIFRNLIRTQTP